MSKEYEEEKSITLLRRLPGTFLNRKKKSSISHRSDLRSQKDAIIKHSFHPRFHNRVIIFRLALFRLFFYIENYISRGDGLIVWHFYYYYFFSSTFFFSIKKNNKSIPFWMRTAIKRIKKFSFFPMLFFCVFRESCEFISLQIDSWPSFFLCIFQCTCFRRENLYLPCEISQLECVYEGKEILLVIYSVHPYKDLRSFFYIKVHTILHFILIRI